MLTQLARRSACQFVYRGILGAICRPQNNRGPILSLPAQELAIQKVVEYGMWDPYMIYSDFTYFYITSPIDKFPISYCTNFLALIFPNRRVTG
jgi:hypothetical protein